MFGDVEGSAKLLRDLRAVGRRRRRRDHRHRRRLRAAGLLPPGRRLRGHRGGPIGDPRDAGYHGVRRPGSRRAVRSGLARFNRPPKRVLRHTHDDWEGAGADAYRWQTSRKPAARTRSLLDRSVQTRSRERRTKSTYHRDKMDDQSNYLGDLSGVDLRPRNSPDRQAGRKSPSNWPPSKRPEHLQCRAERPLAGDDENAAQLRQAVQLYTDAADGAQSADHNGSVHSTAATTITAGRGPARPPRRSNRAGTHRRGGPGGYVAPPRVNFGRTGHREWKSRPGSVPRLRLSRQRFLRLRLQRHRRPVHAIDDVRSGTRPGRLDGSPRWPRCRQGVCR